tara:strand:- start:661 stop:819 length:159 start_codon:yes stop_codon:yes gene_type:complete
MLEYWEKNTEIKSLLAKIFAVDVILIYILISVIIDLVLVIYAKEYVKGIKDD